MAMDLLTLTVVIWIWENSNFLCLRSDMHPQIAWLGYIIYAIKYPESNKVALSPLLPCQGPHANSNQHIVDLVRSLTADVKTIDIFK